MIIGSHRNLAVGFPPTQTGQNAQRKPVDPDWPIKPPKWRIAHLGVPGVTGAIIFGGYLGVTWARGHLGHLGVWASLGSSLRVILPHAGLATGSPPAGLEACTPHVGLEARSPHAGPVPCWSGNLCARPNNFQLTVLPIPRIWLFSRMSKKYPKEWP